MMTRERAEYVIDFRPVGSSFRYSFSGPRGSFNAPTDPKGITPEEDDYIRELWKISGSSTYSVVVRIIANGENILKLYWVALSRKDESSPYQVQEKGDKVKTLADVSGECKNHDMMLWDGFCPDLVKELLDIWNKSQSSSANIQWIYNNREISDENIQDHLDQLNSK